MKTYYSPPSTKVVGACGPCPPPPYVTTPYRRCRGILEYSHDIHAESPGSNLSIAAALLSFKQSNLSTLLLSTQVYKWGPGRMWQIIVFEFASAIITGCYTRQRMLPGCAP